MNPLESLDIAVLVPCFNEEIAIGNVVSDFHAALPTAEIYVFDNNSSDRTIEVAARAGATVLTVPLQGKGNVVRRMFADVDADVYVMVDGDGTYDASAAPKLIEKLVAERLDMVVGSRVSDQEGSYRPGHRLGNAALTGFAALIFGRTFTDMLSGYRVFSRRYVKSFAAESAGFETETELTVHALELRMPVAEVPTAYGARPMGSTSKLNTYRDGWRILMTIMRLFKLEKPFAFFGISSSVLALFGIGISIPVVETYLETGLVPRLPTAVLSTGLMILAALSLHCGLVLDTVTKGRRETKRMAYLATPATRLPSPRKI